MKSTKDPFFGLPCREHRRLMGGAHTHTHREEYMFLFVFVFFVRKRVIRIDKLKKTLERERENK